MQVIQKMDFEKGFKSKSGRRLVTDVRRQYMIMTSSLRNWACHKLAGLMHFITGKRTMIEYAENINFNNFITLHCRRGVFLCRPGRDAAAVGRVQRDHGRRRQGPRQEDLRLQGGLRQGGKRIHYDI